MPTFNENQVWYPSVVGGFAPVRRPNALPAVLAAAHAASMCMPIPGLALSYRMGCNMIMYHLQHLLDRNPMMQKMMHTRRSVKYTE